LLVGTWAGLRRTPSPPTVARRAARAGPYFQEVPVADFLATVLAKAAVMLIEALVTRLIEAFAGSRVATA
jgi:hypothetical protein